MRHFSDLIQDLLRARTVPPVGANSNRQGAAPVPRMTQKSQRPISCIRLWAPSVSPAVTDGVPDVIREAIEDGIKHMQRAKERYPHVSDK